ncbi:DNA-binding transcriptional regulator, MarR family [Streptomyces sp. TLI_053]|uniref:MarR family winged helix-turn-helix transcriptional regulator n=1 Tax=Streptomyces sp. TLI_053 TaxID=1855352 RepID=UPI00087AB947|nr:MarR family transcriptional regulator [Streptomyces sp. TLI_053]SDT81211.1 DNA-binding transcriptional regulator, MarR family [Streptomyces sp. TLI_053]
MTAPEQAGPAPGPEAGGAGPGPLDAAAVARLRLVIARLHRRLAQSSAGQEFTFAQQSAIARIEQHGPLRLGELAALEGVSAPSMTRTVGPLVTSGVVERLPDPTDGRSFLVAVAPAGAELLAGIRRQRSEHLARRAEALTPEEQGLLLAALPVLEHLLAAEDA